MGSLRVIGATLLTVTLWWGPILPASAHYKYTKLYVYRDAFCVEVRSEASHGLHDDGYLRVDVWSSHHIGGNCDPAYQRPAGDIRAQWLWMYSKTMSGQPAICLFDFSPRSTSKTAHFVEESYTGFNRKPACGTGFYRTFAKGQVCVGDICRPLDPEFHANWVDSGRHFFDAGGTGGTGVDVDDVLP